MLSHPIQVQHHSAEGGPPLDVMSSPLSSLRRSVMSSPKSSQDSESEGLLYASNRLIHNIDFCSDCIPLHTNRGQYIV